MGFAIPKIEYLNKTITGNTSIGVPTVSSPSTTAGIVAGMNVRGTGIPTNTKVLTVTSSIGLDKNATASGTGVSLEFYYPIEFDYPPVEKNGAILDPKERGATAISGTKQVLVDYIEETRAFRFSFLSQSIYLLMKDFMMNHALYGREFRYYEDKTLTPYNNYELMDLKFTPEKIAPKGVDVYVWEVPLKFRRAL